MTGKQTGREDKSGGMTAWLGRLPVVTLGIIAINVLMLIITRNTLSDTVAGYGLKPSELSVGRMLSANFLHDGWVHLTTNMLLLYIFGRDVERAMGKLEFVLFYIGSCLAASVLHAAIVLATLPQPDTNQVVVGASGAVAGVMGIYAVRFHRKLFNIGGMETPALLLILFWLVLQLGLGILAIYRDNLIGLGLRQVGYWCHLGGFTFGMVVAWFTNMALHGEREYLIASAQANYDEGSLLEAAQNYESLLRYEPDNALAHAELGRLWGILDEADQSLPYYQAAIDLYASQGNEEQALARAEEMRQFWPDAGLAAPIRFRLASYLEEAGHPERAIEGYRSIIESSGDSIEAQMSLLKIGQLQLNSLNDPTAAITTLCGFMKRYPTSEWRRFAEQTLARAESSAHLRGVSPA